MRYRIVVGEVGSEQGHIVETAARTDHGAAVVLGRELAKYHGDGWGRVEVDLYDDGRWDRYAFPPRDYR